MTRERFGVLPDGRPVDKFTLHGGGLTLQALNYGGVITSILAPDRRGRLANIVLGHERLEPYLDNRPYIGAVVGRYANRIAGARFLLDGHYVQLPANEGRNQLHGGADGFHQQLWEAAAHETGGDEGVVLTRTSPAGEGGYPGTLQTTVSYTVTRGAVVRIDYTATTDATTVVNLSQHTYFNLSGNQASSVLNHWLTLHAPWFTPVDAELIPTGEIKAVEGTPFDLRSAVRLDSHLAMRHEQLTVAGGFDHNWILEPSGDECRLAARLSDPESGRELEISTTEPGLQFYDGHLLPRGIAEAKRHSFVQYSGLCLETQHFPDSPNHAEFPSTTLRPGAVYRSRTDWRFFTS